MTKNVRLLSVGLLFLAAVPAWGAELVEQQRGQSETIEVMIVTAEKRAENVQDVPASITTFSQIQIEDAAISNVQELTLMTPNLHMKSGASSNMLIFRGISNDADFIHSPASLYVDDIAYSMNFMHNPDLVDVERIEVLRGPQGTLYGRNSESGVVNIITRQPGNQVEGRVFSELGVYDPDHGSSMSYRAGLNLSGPVIEDALYLGLAGEIERSDGYIYNSLTDNDKAQEVAHENLRLTTRLTPSERLEISAIFDYLNADDGNGNKRYLEGPWQTSPHEITYNTDDNSIRQEANGQNLKVKYSGEGYDLISITGRRHYESHMRRDGASSGVDDGVNDLVYDSDMVTEELRISSPESDNGFEWLGGLYLLNEKNGTDIDIPRWGEIRNSEIRTRGYAVFGQSTVTVKEKIHITAGLRFNYDDMDGEMTYSSAAGTVKFGDSFSNSVVLPKLSISYDIGPNLLTYTTISRGYYPGGYNSSSAVNADAFSFDPEYTWNYEAGMKSFWWDQRIRLNVALFYIDINDKQVAQFDAVTDSMEVQNAAEAHSQGIELELQIKPLPGLDLYASLGLTDVVFDQWVATERTKGQNVEYDYGDKDLPNAPRYTGHLGAQYRHHSGLIGRVDYIVTDDYYSDAKNTHNVDGKQLVNLRLGYEGESYDITLWGKNLLNEEYQTIGFARRFNQAVDGEPRMFGVTLVRRF